MKQNFPACLAIILKEEGGNDDDPQDHGGRTSRGITQKEWDIWRKSHGGLPSDVWAAPQDQIDAIYQIQYWQPYCDELPSGADLEFFNASVNSGRLQAVKELQRALGVKADGMLGIETIAAANAANASMLVTSMSDQRRAFYQQLAQFSRYGKGWMARTDRVETSAYAMAKGAAPIHITPPEPESPRADPVDMSQPPVSVQTATATSAAATVTGAISDQLQTLSTAITPLSDTFHWVKFCCVGIALVCAVLAIFAVIHNNRTKAVT